jgi:hypothetical protein
MEGEGRDGQKVKHSGPQSTISFHLIDRSVRALRLCDFARNTSCRFHASTASMDQRDLRAEGIPSGKICEKKSPVKSKLICGIRDICEKKTLCLCDFARNTSCGINGI